MPSIFESISNTTTRTCALVVYNCPFFRFYPRCTSPRQCIGAQVLKEDETRHIVSAQTYVQLQHMTHRQDGCKSSNRTWCSTSVCVVLCVLLKRTAVSNIVPGLFWIWNTIRTDTSVLLFRSEHCGVLGTFVVHECFSGYTVCLCTVHSPNVCLLIAGCTGDRSYCSCWLLTDICLARDGEARAAGGWCYLSVWPRRECVCMRFAVGLFLQSRHARLVRLPAPDNPNTWHCGAVLSGALSHRTVCEPPTRSLTRTGNAFHWPGMLTCLGIAHYKE